MAKPYSDDFRQKVMQAIELDGLKKSEASQLFNISRNTINLWCQRKAKTGDVKPKRRQVYQQELKSTIGRSFGICQSPSRCTLTISAMRTQPSPKQFSNHFSDLSRTFSVWLMARFQLGTISTEQVWGLAPYSPTVS
jgi:transposase-like protein